MCPLVAAKFGFINKKTLAAIKSNAALAAAVLVNYKNLIYKDCQQCKGAFKVKLIKKGIIKWCYDKKVSMGVKNLSYFKDEETGRSISHKSYYDLLVPFYKGTKQAEIVLKICKKLLKSVCHYASIPNNSVATGFTEQIHDR
ncbi:hypothetical protein BDR06DRAFT_974772 [Suillus hirtellus]|nr:hypothetical protein BDR06DRAFT_974772 [Suillus hirtellus]